MDVAELVLDYIRALAWPAVVAGFLYAFRQQIKSKFDDLTEVSTAGGTARFARQAKEALDSAERATEELEARAEAETPSPPEEPADLERQRLAALLGEAWVTAHRRIESDEALILLDVSPNAAVMHAYADLERFARAASVATFRAEPPQQSVGRLVSEIVKASDQLPRTWADVARSLTHLRNGVAHGREKVTEEAGLNFVQASEQLAQALASHAKSRLRHPSVMSIFREWLTGPDAPGNSSESDDEV